MRARLYIEGAGTAILLLAADLLPLLSPYHLTLYHNSPPVSSVVAGLGIDLVLAGLFCAFALGLLDRCDPKQGSFVWSGLLALLAVRIADALALLLNMDYASRIWQPAMRLRLLFAAGGTALLLWRFFPRIFRESVQAARVAVFLAGCCIFWMLPQIAFIAARTHAIMPDAFVHRLPAPAPSAERVIWVLLDELSYDQVFEHRQPDLLLPHFDRLKRQSVLFSDVQPAGYFTERILPSLFLGRKVDLIRSSVRKDLYVHDAEASRWEPFNPSATLFAEAKRSGWTTGISGWYNPYCHILQGVLDSCYWTAIAPLPYKMSGKKNALVNALAFPPGMLLSHLQGGAAASETAAGEHAQEYEEVMQAADSLIRNESIRFAFIHLPLPHPPGIYDRKTGVIGAHGTYLDNLALADRTLGSILDTLRGTASAARTTLIISSDHSWRTNLWRADAAWSREEERASGGKFDPRPVLLIHFPGEDTAELRTQPFPELETHTLIQSMLENKLHTRADLDQWLDVRQSPAGQKLLASGY